MLQARLAASAACASSREIGLPQSGELHVVVAGLLPLCTARGWRALACREVTARHLRDVQD